MDARVVTGEAVALDVRLARWPSRALALLIDVTIQIAMLLIAALVLGMILVASVVGGANPDSALGIAVFTVMYTLVLVVYPVAVEQLSHGRSAGKAAMGLRVVADDGSPVRFRQSLVRALLAVFFDVWATLGAGGLIVSIFNRRGKRLGDILAGTVVVQGRLPRQQAPVAAMPPPLAWWASGLDLSAVSDDLALRIRLFLSRQHELAPQAREALGGQLVGELSGHVAAPPPGTPGWAFLTAVAAERHRRATTRAAATRPAAGPEGGSPPAAGQVAVPQMAGPTAAAAVPNRQQVPSAPSPTRPPGPTPPRGPYLPPS